MGSTDESFSNTGHEPKDYFLTETYVESLAESMTEPQFPEQWFLEDVDYDDAAIGEMLFNAHREQVYHSQRERPVCWSVVVVRVRLTGATPLWNQWQKATIDRGNPLWKEVKNETLNTHRLRLSWADRGSKSSPTVRRRLENTNSRLIMTEEVCNN